MSNLRVSLVLTSKNDASAGIKRVGDDVKKLGTQLKSMAAGGLKRVGADLAAGLLKAERVAQRLEGTMRRAARSYNTMNSAVAGAAAGAYMVAPKVERTMSYEHRIAALSNVAYADQNTQGRQQGMKVIDAAIQKAVRIGGGTRDNAADTYEAMIASGAVNQKTANDLLPVLQKYSTATGADSKELANIAIRSLQSFGLTAEQIPEALDRAIQAGQDGGFELADMAKWLPQQLAAAKNMGMSGMGDFSKLLAANQAAVITAGTKDEAGNNLVNLLAKISSRDTKNQASKITVDGKGVDLTGSMLKAKSEGMSSLDAFVGIVDKIVASDKDYQALKKKAANESDADRKATFESMGDILQGSAIGELIQDRQALMALVSLMNNRDYVQKIEANQSKASGAGEKNFDLIKTTGAFKIDQGKNEWAIAEQGAFDTFNQKLGETAVALSGYAQQYPALAIAVVGVTTALTALAAAAGAAGLMSILTKGRRRGGGKLPSKRNKKKPNSKVPKNIPDAPLKKRGFSQKTRKSTNKVPATSAPASKLVAPIATAAHKMTAATKSLATKFPTGLGKTAMKLGGLGKATGIGNLVMGGATLAAIATDDSMSKNEKKQAYVSTGGGMAGAAAGAAAGALIGSVVPVLGTAIGGALGGILGGLGGGFIGDKLGQKMFNGQSPAVAQKQEAPKVDVHIDTQPVAVTANLVLDGRIISNYVAKAQAQLAVRG